MTDRHRERDAMDTSVLMLRYQPTERFRGVQESARDENKTRRHGWALKDTNKRVQAERGQLPLPLPPACTAALIGTTCLCEAGPAINNRGRKNGQAALILITAGLEQISLHLSPRLNNNSLPIGLPRSNSSGRETGSHLGLFMEPSCLLLQLVAALLTFLREII